jgi:SAM-dependent methyltransferase
LPDFDKSPNRATYESAKFVGHYAGFEELFPAEAKIFTDFSKQFSGRVLDIAIGGGRTTRALLPKAKQYFGSDYSEGMVRAAQAAFPSAELRQLDMRDAPKVYAGQQFDAIVISFNGIDLISWEDRCTLLQGLPALLAPNGVFVFSVHDLANADKQRGFHLRPDLRETLHTIYKPRSLARFIIRTPSWFLRAWGNRIRNRHLEKDFDGYSYLNDSGEDFGLLTTYVSMAKQTEVLKSCGYTKIQILQPWLQNEQRYFNYFTCQL